LTDLSDLQDPFPEPPKDISDRLTKVANANKDCVDSHFDFGGK
jgi:hypothetical protein